MFVMSQRKRQKKLLDVWFLALTNVQRTVSHGYVSISNILIMAAWGTVLCCIGIFAILQNKIH
ncbi:MAG: hypothetical protein COA46_12180 [Porticoccaceae bacterium]|nr:MAG: hypothetical protein COA46_12180 [Porticoccaceae bacterium]